MNPKAQTLIKQATLGAFKQVNNAINKANAEVTLDDYTAAEIVIECCRIFGANKSPAHIEEEDLCQLLTSCAQTIKNIKHENVVRYLKSVCYILEHFTQKNDVQHVLQLKNVLLPRFINLFTNEEVVKIYGVLSYHIHQLATKLSHSKISSETEQYIEFCKLSVQIAFIYSTQAQLLVGMIQTYSNSKKFKEVDAVSRYNYYIYILSLVDELASADRITDPKDIYTAVVKVLEFFFACSQLSCGNFEQVLDFVELAVSKLERFCTSEQQQKLIEILRCAKRFTIELNEENYESFEGSFKECFEKYKSCCETYGTSREVQGTTVLLHEILCNLSNYYATVTPEIWMKSMTENTQTALYQLIGAMAFVISKCPFKCTQCGSANCQVNTNLLAAVKVLSLMGNLFKTSVTKWVDIPDSVHRYVLHYLGTFSEMITNMKNKECAYWKQVWATVKVLIYNIGSKLYSAKQTSCEKYFTLIIRNDIKFEDTVKTSNLKFDVLGTCLSCLTQIYLETGRLQEALRHITIQMVLAPDSNTYKLWAVIKSKQQKNDNQKQPLSVVCVLEQNEGEIKNLYPEINLNLNASRKTKLLLGELAVYQQIWPTVTNTKAAFRKLYEIADLMTVVRALIPAWIKLLANSHDDIMPLLDEIFSRFQQEVKVNDDERQIYLAVLYTIKYCMETTKMSQKICSDMKKTAIPTKMLQPVYEIPKHPGDECDMVASYRTLKLDKSLELFKLLQKAISGFDSVNCTFAHVNNILTECDINTFVTNIGYEFHLQCDVIQATRSWFVGAKISKALEDNLAWLCNVSLILSASDMNSSVAKELLTESSDVMSKLEEKNENVWRTFTYFHINKSKMLLNNQDIRAGYEEYQEAVKCFEKLQGNELKTLKMQLDFLHVQYLHQPCSFEIEGHFENSLSKLMSLYYEVFNNATSRDFMKTDSMLIGFEVIQFVAHMYRWMNLPREVRCYARDIVVHAEKLALPLRTAYYLIYLAQADLLGQRFDDCQVKLNGLSDVLCLGNKTYGSSPSQMSSKPVVTYSEDVGELADNFAEIMLDCTSDTYKHKELSGSPLLPMQPFKLPFFTKHADKCDCYFCMNVDYKRLVLMYFTLQAELHAYHGDTMAANNYINGAMKIHKIMMRLDWKFQEHATNLLLCYPFHPLKDLLCQSVAVMLLSYVKILLNKNDFKTAERMSKTIICDFISPRKYENLYLYNEALLQYATILVNNKCSKEEYLKVDYQQPCDNSNKPEVRTPENKQSQVVVFSSCYSPRPESPPKCQIRKIKCNFAEAEAPESEVKDNKDVEKVPTCKTSTTPWLPSTKRTTRKNKAILQQMPVPPLPLKVFSDIHSSSIVPMSPEAYTPASAKASSVLQSRTKKLTRRLKQSVPKKGEETHENQNGHSSAVAVGSNACKTSMNALSTTDNVCKNLMSELSTADKRQKGKPKQKTTRRKSPASSQGATTSRATRATTRNK